MAESQSEKIHYVLSCPEVVDEPHHMYAISAEDAVKRYVEGENPYGYDMESFDFYDVFIVPASQITRFSIAIEDGPEPPPPPPPERVISWTKHKKGDI